jgi:FtsZ-binding cell division protein ZapB
MLLYNDTKNEEMTGTELLVDICYGKAKSEDYKQSGEVIIDALRSDYRVERAELMKKLGLNPKKENDRQKFQRRIKALLNKNDGGYFVCVGSRREDGNCYYHLSRDYFDSVVHRIVQNVRNTITTKPNKEIERLREYNQQLETENSELQNYVQRLQDESEHDREKREAAACALLRQMVYDQGMPDSWREYHETIRDRLVQQGLAVEDTKLKTIKEYTEAVREDFERKYIG